MFEKIDREIDEQREVRYREFCRAMQRDGSHFPGMLISEAEIPDFMLHPLPVVGERVQVLGPPSTKLSLQGAVGTVKGVKTMPHHSTMVRVKLDDDGMVVDVLRVLIAPAPKVSVLRCRRPGLTGAPR